MASKNKGLLHYLNTRRVASTPFQRLMMTLETAIHACHEEHQERFDKALHLMANADFGQDPTFTEDVHTVLKHCAWLAQQQQWKDAEENLLELKLIFRRVGPH